MATVVVRGLEEAVKTSVAERARRNGSSEEAELREIITQAAKPENLAEAI